MSQCLSLPSYIHCSCSWVADMFSEFQIKYQVAIFCLIRIGIGIGTIFESQIQPVVVDTNVGFSKSRTIALGMNSSRSAAPRPTLPRPNPECCDHECYPEDDAPDEKCCWHRCGRTPWPWQKKH